MDVHWRPVTGRRDPSDHGTASEFDAARVLSAADPLDAGREMTYRKPIRFINLRGMSMNFGWTGSL